MDLYNLYGGASQYNRRIQLANMKKQKAKKRKEKAKANKEFWKKLQAGVLLTMLPVAEAYKHPIDMRSEGKWSSRYGASTKLRPDQTIASCTGNTCRSASLQIHADARGIPLTTCGTDPDGVSGTPTTALIASMQRQAMHPNATTFERTLLDDGRSMRQAVSCGCDHLQDPNRPFIIVANPSNKAHLLAKAEKCGIKDKDFANRVVVSHDLTPKCNILKEDPWYQTKAGRWGQGVQGPFTELEQIEEDQAYDNLRDGVGECLDGLTELTFEQLDKALQKERARSLNFRKPKVTFGSEPPMWDSGTNRAQQQQLRVSDKRRRTEASHGRHRRRQRGQRKM